MKSKITIFPFNLPFEVGLGCGQARFSSISSLASRRFPLWSVHTPDEKPTRMPSSSSCPTEIKGLESSGTCWMLCSTNVEPPGRLSSTVPIPIMAQCCEFLTWTESECQAEYCRNWDRWGVTWYDVPESTSHVLDSSIVSSVVLLAGLAPTQVSFRPFSKGVVRIGC